MITVSKSCFGKRNTPHWQNVFADSNVKYNYFTDDDISGQVYREMIDRGVNVQNVDDNNCTIDAPLGTASFRSRRKAKLYKIIPDMFDCGSEYYIWMDAYFELKMSPQEIITKSGFADSDSPVALFKHSQRDCVYEEMDVLKNIKYDHAPALDMQKIFYESSLKHPENGGLYECTCMIFDNSIKSKLFRLEWLSHINRFSSRDQVSLPVILRQMNITPHILEGKILPGFGDDNPYFVSLGNR